MLVALWSDNHHLLLVRTSYRPLIGLPGGFVRSSESPTSAAVREIREEVGIDLDPQRLVRTWHGTVPFEFRQDSVTIFEAHVEHALGPVIDRREIVWAGWMSRDEALRRPLLPHIRAYLEGQHAATQL